MKDSILKTHYDVTLDEFLNLFGENLDVSVINSETQEELAFYDGKNSIPVALNERRVIGAEIDWSNKKIRVEIEGEI